MQPVASLATSHSWYEFYAQDAFLIRLVYLIARRQCNITQAGLYMVYGLLIGFRDGDVN
jgi:hypothetical protein